MGDVGRQTKADRLSDGRDSRERLKQKFESSSKWEGRSSTFHSILCFSEEDARELCCCVTTKTLLVSAAALLSIRPQEEGVFITCFSLGRLENAPCPYTKKLPT